MCMPHSESMLAERICMHDTHDKINSFIHVTFNVMWCFNMSLHITTYIPFHLYITPRHITSCRHHATSHHATSCHCHVRPWDIVAQQVSLVIIIFIFNQQVMKRTKTPCSPLKTVKPLWTNLYQKPSPQFPPPPLPLCGSQKGRQLTATPSPIRSTNHSPPPLSSGCWCIQPSPCSTVRWNIQEQPFVARPRTCTFYFIMFLHLWLLKYTIRDRLNFLWKVAMTLQYAA